MRRQRNNIAALEYEQRQLISRLLFEGRTYDEVRKALAAAGCTARMHSSTFGAWQKSAEYREYCEVRKGFDERSARNRLAAAVLNDGHGPQSLADIAEYELLQQIVGLVGDADSPAAAAALASSLSSLKRAQATRAAEALKAEMAALREAHAAEIAARDAEIARLRGEVETVKAGGQVDLARVADSMERLLGGN